MKHGRRHNKLKEQTYRRLARKDTEGYSRPYAAMDTVESRSDGRDPEPAPAPSLSQRLDRRAKNRLRFLGIEPESEDE